MRITYVGHATLLMELAGIRILTDPNFDPKLGRFLPRVSPPGIEFERLPKLDALLLTHAHADHLSFRTLRQLPGDIPLYAPAPVATWLARQGFRQAIPLSPGNEVRVGGVTIDAAAARHAGARYSLDRWRGATNMYLLRTDVHSAFFAGDTALTPDTHRLVAERLHEYGRGLDVALLPIGHAPWWKRSAFRRGHLSADDALSLYDRLRADWLVPCHWGTFRHVTSGPHDAISRFRHLVEQHERRGGVRILQPGEALDLAAHPPGAHAG